MWLSAVEERCLIADRRNESVMKYYLDNEQTSNHHSLTFALRELNETEVSEYCVSRSLSLVGMDEKRNFTSDYYLRLYQSGCYYLDENRRWRSDGMRVSDDVVVVVVIVMDG